MKTLITLSAGALALTLTFGAPAPAHTAGVAGTAIGAVSYASETAVDKVHYRGRRHYGPRFTFSYGYGPRYYGYRSYRPRTYSYYRPYFRSYSYTYPRYYRYW